MGKKEDSMLAELETMEVEGEMIQAEDDAGNSAPEQAQKESPAPVVEPSPDVKQQPVSYLQDSETVQEDRPKTHIPVSELQKERKRRQAAEQELAALKAHKEQEPATVDVSSELASLGDEEFIDKKTVIPLVQRVKEATKREVMAELQQQRETDNLAQQHVAAQNRISASEANARKQFSDFDTTVQAAINAGGFTPDEIASIKRSSNPGAVLYRKSKEALAILGITVNQKPNPTPPPADNETEVETDSEDNIYEKVFGKKSG